MKPTLLYTLAFSVLILFGCKKEAEYDPFTDITDFNIIMNHDITLNSNNDIVHFLMTQQNGSFMVDCNIIYHGDSIAERNYTLSEDGYTEVYQGKYYLNSLGYADSAVAILYHNYEDTSYTDTLRLVYQYNQDGFLIFNSGSNPMDVYSVVGNNYCKPQDEYYDYVSKVDLFSTRRAFDNNLSGKNDYNLPKVKRQDIVYTPSNPGDEYSYYYYKFDVNGYVTNCIIINGDSKYKKNYTYQFIQ